MVLYEENDFDQWDLKAIDLAWSPKNWSFDSIVNIKGIIELPSLTT